MRTLTELRHLDRRMSELGEAELSVPANKLREALNFLEDMGGYGPELAHEIRDHIESQIWSGE